MVRGNAHVAEIVTLQTTAGDAGIEGNALLAELWLERARELGTDADE